MAALEMLGQRLVDPISPNEIAQPENQSFGSIFNNARQLQAQTGNIQGSEDIAHSILDPYIAKVEQATGQPFYNQDNLPQGINPQDNERDIYTGTMSGSLLSRALDKITGLDAAGIFNKKIEDLKQQYPTADFEAKSMEDLQTEYNNKFTETKQALEQKSAQANPQGGLLSTLGNFVGSAVGFMQDPRNVAASLLGGVEGGAAKGAAAVVGSIAKAFGLGAASMLPSQVEMFGRTPNETTSEKLQTAAENVAMGGATAGVFRGLGALGHGLWNYFKGSPDLKATADAVTNMPSPEGATPQQASAFKGSQYNIASDLQMIDDLGVKSPEEFPQVRENLANAAQDLQEGRTPALTPSEYFESLVPDQIKDDKFTEGIVSSDPAKIAHTPEELANDPTMVPHEQLDQGVPKINEPTGQGLAFVSEDQAIGYMKHFGLDSDSVKLVKDAADIKAPYTFLDKSISPDDVVPIANKVFDTQREANSFIKSSNLDNAQAVQVKDGYVAMEDTGQLTKELKDKLSATPSSYLTRPPEYGASSAITPSEVNTSPDSVAPRETSTQKVLREAQTQDQVDKINYSDSGLKDKLDSSYKQLETDTNLNLDQNKGLKLNDDLPGDTSATMSGSKFKEAINNVKNFIKEFTGCSGG